MNDAGSTPLGAFLRERRSRIDPAALGFTTRRRRTPGLRREEVAQRAEISQAWYTWLEQGRGGAPSADVLNRLARALLMTDAEREHLFLLGLGRPPAVTAQPVNDMSPRLQRVLDRLDPSPALIRTGLWDVIGWNEAVTRFLMDFGALPPTERNLLRIMFREPSFRVAQTDWQETARLVIGAFWRDAVRSGSADTAEALIADIGRQTPELTQLWREKEIHGQRDGIKHLRHPQMGRMSFEYSTFGVDGRADLTMVVFNPIQSP